MSRPMTPPRNPPPESSKPLARFVFIVHALGPLHRRLMGVRAARPSLFFGCRDGRNPREVLTLCSLRLGDTALGTVVAIPMEPQLFLSDQERALDCMVAAVAKAGPVQAVGLGSLCAVVAGRGEGLAERVEVPVTNGGAATAWAIWGNVRAVLDRVGRDRPVAVIGARGPVGGVIADLLLADGVSVRVDHPRAAKGRDVFAARNPEEAVAGCRVIVGAGPTGRVLPAHALSQDSVLIDVALPGTLIGSPPSGALVFAGEAVTLPDQWRRGGWGSLYHVLAGYGPLQAFACLVEPLVLAVTGRNTPFSIGRQLSKQAVLDFGAGAEALGFRPRMARGWFAYDSGRIPRLITERGGKG
jgi:predicted amino acid dehydrogenase